jgi:hypothetical protein
MRDTSESCVRRDAGMLGLLRRQDVTVKVLGECDGVNSDK